MRVPSNLRREIVDQIFRVGNLLAERTGKPFVDQHYEKLPEDEARALAMRIFIAETRVMALGCLIIAAPALPAGTKSGGL